MKQINCFFYICLLFVGVMCTSFSVIKELFQFQQSLQRLTTFLGKPQTTPPGKKPIITTYEELRKVVNTASTANNANLLDTYEPTIATLTAKYLLEEYFKERTAAGKDADYIPFIAYMVQQVTDRYPDKNTELRCISLDQNNMLEEKLLENEFLLIRALVHLGYQHITIIPMNLWYPEYEKESFLPRKFKEWIEKNIPALKNDIFLDLLWGNKTEYTYISDIKKGDAPRNNLFFMLGSYDRTTTRGYGDLLNTLASIFKESPNINFFSFEKTQPTNFIKVYLPYDPSDIFITSSIPNTEEKIEELQNYIKSKKLTSSYQQDLVRQLIVDSYPSILGSEIARGRIGVNIDLFFLDLIKHTAIDPTKPLAFRGLGADEMIQIKDMSGTLQQVYDRYKRP